MAGGHESEPTPPSAPGAARPVKVLTVDDQPMFLGVARELIEATPGFEHVGEAESGRQALALTAELSPDLVLLDIRMPGMNGIETAERLAVAHPDAVVVLVSAEDAPQLPSGVASSRAAAYVRKQDLSTRALRRIWNRHGRPASQPGR